jgi:hypothetical protein
VWFNGFGISDYGREGFPMLEKPWLRNDLPPFYQPKCASLIGGSFADTVCICNTPGILCRCKMERLADLKESSNRVKVVNNLKPVLGWCGVPKESFPIK